MFHQMKAAVGNDQIVIPIDRHIPKVPDIGLDCDTPKNSAMLQLADCTGRNISCRDMKTVVSKIDGMPAVAAAEVKDASIGRQQIRQINDLGAWRAKGARAVEILVRVFPEWPGSVHERILAVGDLNGKDKGAVELRACHTLNECRTELPDVLTSSQTAGTLSALEL